MVTQNLRLTIKSTYVCHKLPVGLQDLEGGVQYSDHELPQFTAGGLRDRNVGQIAKHIVNLLPFSNEFVDCQHAVFNDHLEMQAIIIFIAHYLGTILLSY